MLLPYRSESHIEKYETKKYGLIKKTGENPWKIFLVFISMFVEMAAAFKALWNKHRCDYPKFFTRLSAAVKGAPFADESLYRCRCGKVWEWCQHQGKWTTYTNSIKMWVEAGGED